MSRHPLQSAPASDVAVERPKHLRHADRPARHVAAGLLDRACEATSTTSPALGRHLGICETVVRGLRSGEKEVTLARVLELPSALRRAVLAQLAHEVAELDAQEGAAALGVEKHLRRIGTAHGRLNEVADEALADGRVDEGERVSLLEVVHDEKERISALERELSRREPT